VDKAPATVTTIRLDLGCGKNKRKDGDWIGVDCRQFEGVDIVADLTKKWQWDDNSVDEAHASHTVEHLKQDERIHFVNELHRVLKPGAKATIITPHWNSCRAYGDMTHQWPPVCEFWYYYLSKAWREVNAPHNDGYTCDFEAVWGYGMHNDLLVRNAEYQQFALSWYKEAAQDLHATLTKRS
jgi:hypothetical protein